MTVMISTVPHSTQRVRGQAGDWYFAKGGDLFIRVSEMDNWRYEALVALHEMIEAILCKARMIDQRQVDGFDAAFQGAGEAGDDPNCPYRKEHFFATSIERLMAAELAVDWLAYEAAVEGL